MTDGHDKLGKITSLPFHRTGRARFLRFVSQIEVLCDSETCWTQTILTNYRFRIFGSRDSQQRFAVDAML